MARLDPHSFSDDTQPQTASLAWKARVDFASRTLEADAALHFKAPASGGPLDLDTRDLQIDAVEDLAGAPLPFVLHPPEPFLGSRLAITVPAGAAGVRVRYRTSPDASALQWLEPGQTAGGKQPFLFSQCQAIHARSVVPLQDTPRLRIRFTAQLTVPAQLKAVMAAAWVKREAAGAEATEHFEMPQPIPPYLFAFAVGELVSRELGPRSRVYAEPSMVEAAAFEFAGVDQMIVAAENLFGPYDWDRFDILTMPPSFPYGGMENPRLTFLTPTIITGDRSLVNVVAHELAHSWTGNLVSNANAEHFWLNEGFTVFAERRILEVLEGKETAALHAALGRRSLDEAVLRFRDQPELTRLRTKLAGVDPDEAYSQVPYEKGCLLLTVLEDAVGREAFSRFLRAYLGKFAFQSITTDDFVALCEEQLPGALAKIDGAAWIDGVGVPANAPVAKSTKLDQIEQLGGAMPSAAEGKSWDVAQWQLYLNSVRRPLAVDAAAELDARFALTASNNFEVLVAWLNLAASGGYAPALPRIEEVLGRVGRMKYLRPLYEALAKRPETKARARACFERFKGGYHPIARQVVEGVLARAGN
jgi:leukotriene-A4 hydrolase